MTKEFDTKAMAGEDHRQTSVDAHEKNSESSLSARVFENPSAFLQTLKSNFTDIDRDHSGDLSVPELSVYAKEAKDPTGRAAASLAANHFDELSKIEDKIPGTPGTFSIFSHRRGLTEQDIKLASDVMSNAPQPYIDRDTHSLRVDGWIKTGLAIGWGALTVAQTYTGVGMVANPLTISLSGINAQQAYSKFSRISTDPELIRNQFDSSRKLMQSWSEFR